MITEKLKNEVLEKMWKLLSETDDDIVITEWLDEETRAVISRKKDRVPIYGYAIHSRGRVYAADLDEQGNITKELIR